MSLLTLTVPPTLAAGRQSASWMSRRLNVYLGRGEMPRKCGSDSQQQAGSPSIATRRPGVPLPRVGGRTPACPRPAVPALVLLNS